MPSEDVITLLPVPEFATATNNVKSGDQQSEVQLLSTADVLLIQVILSDEVITRLLVPVDEIATNKDNSDDHTIEVQLLLIEEFLVYQLFNNEDIKPVDGKILFKF
jgi:hypothetical protein